MPLLLSGCSGFALFAENTHSTTPHVNRPIANSETGRRVIGRPVELTPLSAEPGNVWPGPVVPEPTLEDLQKQPPKPLPDLNGSTPPSISNVPHLVIPVIPHHLQPRPGEDGAVLTGPLPAGTTQSPTGPLTSTPKGNAVDTANPSGVGQVNPSPKPGVGITVPNGDGTSTVIAPDGAISTIPTPK